MKSFNHAATITFAYFIMIIAVNTRSLPDDNPEGYGCFVYECFKRITKKNPEHTFIFIFDRQYDERFIFFKNVIPVVAGPFVQNPLLWKYWYDMKVPAILKKYKADVFVSCDGFCSLTAKVPQCLVLQDLSFLHEPSFTPKSHLLYYKYYTPEFLKKAETIVAVSELSRKDILLHYKINNKDISVVPYAAKELFHPLNDEEKAGVKNKLAGGTEYFVYSGTIHPRKNLINLLKAFSAFKKMQKSNWKLILAGSIDGKYKIFSESLTTYKYRNDVVITGHPGKEELAKIIGSAYCLVYPSGWEDFGLPVLEALQSGVAVITSENSAMQEIARDSALYVNPGDHNDIAEKMMLIYKDEKLRNEMIKKGKIISSEYNWDKSADLLWKCIMKSATT